MKKKEVKILPNPDAYRELCVPECDGCEKQFGAVCMVYSKPSMWKGNCPFNPPKEEVKAKKWVNPLKASKRKRRNR